MKERDAGRMDPPGERSKSMPARAVSPALPGTGTTEQQPPAPPPPSLCLVANMAANLYRTDYTGGVGGVEVQYKLLARQMARQHPTAILFVAPPPGTTLVAEPGVRLVPYEPGSGSLWSFLRGLWRGAKSARSDIYMQSAAGVATFALALFCRLRGRPFVFHWASDADLDGALIPDVGYDRRLFRLGRRMATAQVCQTQRQWEMLRPRERRRAIILPNLLDTAVPWPTADGSEVLWVATIKDTAKRPERFLDLAAALPRRRFRMVGELKGDPAFQAEFRRRLAQLPNVDWVGFVPREGMPRHYKAARVLVNTSDTEGFPNTFLEAAASGVPVVSLNVDPNGILAKDGAGRCLAGDAAALPAAVESFYDDATWRKARAACRRVAERHAPEAIARDLGLFLASLR
ncbi:MAG TPA: glycosyltransferase family 4 protein [Candidatus Thermoplasmatota archaeon]|nr:glycosyltransferase family 4 protein [Candidatus Thermoplasmatota archaeon]